MLHLKREGSSYHVPVPILSFYRLFLSLGLTFYLYIKKFCRTVLCRNYYNINTILQEWLDETVALPPYQAKTV